MRARLTSVVALGLSVVLNASASALGTFDIKPIVLTLRPGETATSVEFTNAGASPQELEIALRSWTQSDSADEGEATDDIVASPSIFVIPAGKTQLVRLGPSHALATDVERTYRLVATEVPSGANAASVAAILRMRLPIFVVPQTIVATPLVWQIARIDADHLNVSARNDGNVHRRIRSLRVDAAGHIVFDNVVAAYVLGHQARHWVVPLPAGASPWPVHVVSTEMDGSRQEATFGER